ncbi:hypothetical protein G6F22_021637 [Rhizopus arrhizus]|nr:hypothetical protein G6F22_021637 [Rhizopus arrhizus]
MFQHVAHLFGRAGRIHAHRYPADGARAQLRQQPLHAVLGHDGHPPAPAQAQGPQAQPDAAGPLPIVRPGQRLPDAEILLPDGDGRWLAPRLLAQHLRQGQFGPHGRIERGDHGLVLHDNQRLRRL